MKRTHPDNRVFLCTGIRPRPYIQEPFMTYECVLASTAQTTSLPQLQAVEGSVRRWQITLRESPDVDSAPIDLTNAGLVEFAAVIADCGRRDRIQKDCKVADPYEGRVLLSLNAGELRVPGLWKGAIRVHNPEGDLLDEYPCRLLIRASVLTSGGVEIPTVGDVRGFLVDRCPADNRLLLSVQFTDDQILDAMQFAVDDWNSTPPRVASFTAATFPWRYQWVLATAAQLLRSAALQQVRNNATYQSGTVTVNDSDKGRDFAAFANQLRQEWREWMTAKKREININLGWGGSGIDAFGGWRP